MIANLMNYSLLINIKKPTNMRKNNNILAFIALLSLLLCVIPNENVFAQKKYTRKKIKQAKTEQKDERQVGAVNYDIGTDDIVLPSRYNDNLRTKDSKIEKDEIFSSAAHMPSFPGGDKALMDYLSENLRYPKDAADKNIQGKVIVQFQVTKKGRIGEVKIARGIHPSLDREAIRVCKSIPKFNPGRNAKGDPVNVWYTLPITFKLASNSDNSNPSQSSFSSSSANNTSNIAQKRAYQFSRFVAVDIDETYQCSGLVVFSEAGSHEFITVMLGSDIIYNGEIKYKKTPQRDGSELVYVYLFTTEFQGIEVPVQLFERYDTKISTAIPTNFVVTLHNAKDGSYVQTQAYEGISRVR